MDGKTYPEHMVFGLDIGTRSIVGTVGYKQNEREFIVVAQSIKFHETRAMLDGQIHDISKVAETIKEVKRELERQIERKLSKVCIAAAGRVLKTVTVYAECEFGSDAVITKEHIHSLELVGVEKGYEAIRRDKEEEESHFYCVGYTVVHYYLNGNMMLNLEEHKGNRIGADVLVTFLPEDVIEGLYVAVEKAGLEVENLTLEPIAAINVAIPEKFRLLNIALVDVGAGTSDLCITKDGTIVAYGMIPRAGDEITNTIVQAHLVDFATAETIKTSVSLDDEEIMYEDIIGLPGKVTSKQVLEETNQVVDSITAQISEKIKELNGGRGVSAVFVVGGGGKLKSFIEKLAFHLELPQERVALRGEEVLKQVHFLQPEVKKDPLLVTPIGICLNYYEKKNSFVYVQVNGDQVKLYDNGHLTIVDAALGYGFPNERLFPRRGASINFTINGIKRLVRGEVGEAAEIGLNGRPAGINAPITQNDIIEIKESTIGAPAYYEIRQLPEFNRTIQFIVNNRPVVCPKLIEANNQLVTEFYSIKDADELKILNYYTVRQLLEFMDITCEGEILVNNIQAQEEEKIYENFSVTCKIRTDNLYEEEKKENVPQENKTEIPIELNVTVNGMPIVLKGKTKYLLVDVLDVYSFDLSSIQGSKVVIQVNKEKADFTKELNQGDQIDMYWEK